MVDHPKPRVRRQTFQRPLKPRTWKDNVIVVFVIIHLVTLVTYVCFGCYAIASHSYGLSKAQLQCEESYHMRKYMLLSVVFNSATLVSYFAFARWKNEENARARATALTVVHLAFAIWGVLTWRKFDSHCNDVVSSVMVMFHHASAILNAVYFSLYCLHETNLKRLSADYTVMVAFQCSPNALDLTHLGTKYQPIPPETAFPKGLPNEQTSGMLAAGFESSHIDATTHANPDTIADSSLPSPLKQTAVSNLMASQQGDSVWWRNNSGSAPGDRAAPVGAAPGTQGGNGAARRAALMTP